MGILSLALLIVHTRNLSLHWSEGSSQSYVSPCSKVDDGDDEDPPSMKDVSWLIQIPATDVRSLELTVTGSFVYQLLQGSETLVSAETPGSDTSSFYILDAEKLREVLGYLLVIFDLEGYGLSLECLLQADMKSLHHRYRGRWDVTDVLAFPQLSFPNPISLDRSSEPSSGHVELGDVVLCVPWIYRLWKKHPRGDFAHHLLWTVVHGFLHLGGHDHKEPEQARVMADLEKRVISLIEEDFMALKENLFRVESRR